MSENAIRTLVVTQSDDVAAKMESLLNQATGTFGVTRTASTRDAVGQCKSAAHDCILYDNSGNDEDAAAFVQRIESECGHLPAPVIALLAEEKKPVLAKLIKGGVTDYLLLPDLQPDTVSRTIRYALERKTLERRLLEQRNLFKAVLGGSPGYIAIKNADLLYQAVNPAFCAFLGKSQEEVAGKADDAFFPKKDAELYKKDDSHVLKSGIPQTKRIEMAGVEGPRWLEVLRTPVIDSKGEVAGVFFAAHDITGAIELEAKVEELNAAMAKLAEDQTEMVCRVAAKGVLNYVNPAVCRAFGKAAEDLIGQGFSTLIPKEAQTDVRNLLASLKPDNPSGTHRQRVTVDGEERWQDWTTRAVYNDSGKLNEFIAVGHDVTGAVRAEAEAAKFKADLDSITSQIEECTHARKLAEDALAEHAAIAKEHAAAHETLQQDLSRAREECDHARNALTDAQQQLEQKTHEIQSLQERLSQLDSQAQEFETQRAQLEQAARDKDEALSGAHQELEARETALRERDAAVADLERRIQESDQLLKAGEAALAESEAEARRVAERAEQSAGDLAKVTQRVDDILELIPTGVFELAAGTKVTFMSPAGSTILGCAPDEAADGNMVLLDFFDPNDKKAATECMKESMQHRTRTAGEFRINRRDGQALDVVLTAAPIVRDDKIMGMHVALTDVSASQHAGALLEAIRRLADATATTAGTLSGIARLTSGIAHNGEARLDAAALESIERASEDARRLLEKLITQSPET